MNAHPLYVAALDADELYADTLEFYGLERFGNRNDDWRIKPALAAKIAADTAWLDFMRADSLRRTAGRS